jgi:hypothetical protein
MRSILLLILGAAGVQAAAIMWDTTKSAGNWTDPSNWVYSPPTYPNNGNLGTTFSVAIGGVNAVTFSGPAVTVDQLNLSHSQASLTVALGSLTLGANPSEGPLLQNAGTVQVLNGGNLHLYLSSDQDLGGPGGDPGSLTNSGTIRVGGGAAPAQAKLLLENDALKLPFNLGGGGKIEFGGSLGLIAGVTGNKSLTTDNQIVGGGTISNLALTLNNTLDPQGGTLTLRLSAGGATLNTAQVLTSGNLVLDASAGGRFNVNGGMTTAGGSLELVAHDVASGGASLVLNGPMQIGAGDTFKISAGSNASVLVQNTAGLLMTGTAAAPATMLLSGANATFTIDSAPPEQSNGFIPVSSAIIRGETGTETLVLNGGIGPNFADILSVDATVSNVAGVINNGEVAAIGNITVNAPFVNNGLTFVGNIYATGAGFRSQGFLNHGDLEVQFGGTADLRGGAFVNADGSLPGGAYFVDDLSTLLFDGSIKTTGAGVSLAVYGVFSSASGAFRDYEYNTGSVSAKIIDATPATGTLINDGVLRSGDMTVHGSFLNRGTYQGLGGSGISATGNFENDGFMQPNAINAGGAALNSGTITDQSGPFQSGSLNNSGTIQTVSSVATTVGDLINSGSIDARGTVSAAGNLINMGSISSSGLSSGGLFRNAGFVIAGGSGSFGAIENDAGHQLTVASGAASATWTVQTDVTNAGALIVGSIGQDIAAHAQGILSIGGKLTNSGVLGVYGIITSAGPAGSIVNAASVENTGSILVTGNFQDLPPFNKDGGRLNVSGDFLNSGSVKVSGDVASGPGAPSNNLGGGIFVGGTFSNSGDVQVIGSDYGEGGRIHANGGFLNSGQVTIAGGRYDGAFVVAPGYSYVQTAGMTTVDGELDAEVVLEGGTLRGSGMIVGAVNNIGGVVDPGDPVTLNVMGNYTQGPGGILEFHIAGIDDYARLVILGNASLDGTLRLLLDRGYTPNLGDQFLLLSYGSVTGDFAFLDSPGFNNLWFREVLQPDGLMVEVVPTPESGTIGLVVAGVAVMMIARRRRYNTP